MSPLIAQLVQEAPVVTDGAWGTQLQARGLPAGACADEWNLSHADEVESVAREYVEAGSRVLLTNTFRANRLALGASQLAGALEAINRAGVEISQRAAAGKALVFASIGPSGKLLATGQVAETLAAAGAEGIGANCGQGTAGNRERQDRLSHAGRGICGLRAGLGGSGRELYRGVLRDQRGVHRRAGAAVGPMKTVVADRSAAGLSHIGAPARPCQSVSG